MHCGRRTYVFPFPKVDSGPTLQPEYREKVVHDSTVLVDSDLMTSAFDGENAEHEETVWQAVKSHPTACFWAFIMCFTIVSPACQRDRYLVLMS